MQRHRLHIHKGDKVVVISGAYKSTQPHEVLRVLADAGKVIIEGINLRWKHQKRSQQNPKGGRVQQEAPIEASNVLLYSEQAKKGVRTRIEQIDGKRVRVGIPCGTKFD